MDKTIIDKEKYPGAYPIEAKTNCSLSGELIQGKENIERLSNNWDELFNRAKGASINLSRTWIQTFIDENHYRGKLRFITVWNDKKLVALLPLYIHKTFGIRIAKLISVEIPTYLGLLLDPDYPLAVSIVAETWIREKAAHIFDNKHVSTLDKATQSFVTELKNRGFKSTYGYERISYGMELGCSFEEYMQKTKTGKRRRKLGYAERQLFKDGNVKISNYTGKEITSEILRRIAQIQEESWLKSRGASVLKESFYQKLLNNMSQAGFGSVWLMTIDGEDAAFAFTSIAHDILYYQYVAFKLKYKSSLSIGQILLMQIIRDACERNIKYFEFGQGEAEYKRFWSNHKSNVLWVVAGCGFIGIITILFYRLAWLLAGQKYLLSLYKRIHR
jgi:CelD/BcsL family acetyltransferase involved in cellulose biosynthesis